MAFFVSVALFVALAATIGLFGYRRYARPGRLLERFDHAPAPPPAPMRDRPQAPPKRSLLLKPIQALGRLIPVSSQDTQSTRRQLLAAGYRGDNAIAMLYGVKVILSLILGILSIMFRTSMTVNPILRIVLPVAGFGMGYWLPGFLLERRTRKRQERLRLG